jgi:ATP-dependent helicase/nuclease subunit A
MAPIIKTVVASAGSGKTTRIVGDIASEVSEREPEEIIATTFTIKAADELTERTRARLFELGQSDKAARLLGARFGTVNSICSQIVTDFALDLGRSPSTEVIPEENVERIFAIAANAAIDRNAPQLNNLAEAFGMFEPRRGGDDDDWRATVRRIIELARANGIGAEGLARSADRSVDTFLSLLPNSSCGATAGTLDEDLSQSLLKAVGAIPDSPSATARDSVALVRQAKIQFDRGEQLSWPNWARLTKIKCAKTKDGQGLVDAFDAIIRAASMHAEHPRLRQHCEEFIRTLLDCASEALTAYQDYKAARGLLDFIDQESLALKVLHDPSMKARLAELVSRVFVDEFQDSSPLQIAIFTALADIVDVSTWVGDPKQAIYGFRNADSNLTQAAFQGVSSDQEASDVLSKSYRSRRGIIDLVNAGFTPAFDVMGLKSSQHAFSDTARSEEGLPHPALAVWWLNGKIELQAAAMARGIRDALSAPEDWPVAERAESIRPMQAGDIAVLCRSNDNITAVARALGRQGIKVAVERDGLAQTPHVELATAALRWIADPSDRLALAELARFFAQDPQSDEWLRAVSASDQDAALKLAVPISGDLALLREQILALTPAELIDAILSIPAVRSVIEGWGDIAVRLDDLEALRGFARAYENECAGSGAPATASGLVLALKTATPQRPKSLRPDAVKVMTYHGAKGLEWPMVIMTGLNREPRPRLYQATAEAGDTLDWRNPLANRWIRYWPWPYGSQKKDVIIDRTAPSSTIGRLAAKSAREEETRLLYVGATRARDYLVFAPAAKDDTNWLGVLDTPAQPNHLALPKAGDAIRIGDASFSMRIQSLSADDQVQHSEQQPIFVGIKRSGIRRASLHRQPSNEADDGKYEVMECVELGPRLPIVGNPDMAVLGEAIHAVFAADINGWEPEKRLARASKILARWGAHQVSPANILCASDRLHDYLIALWPDAQFRREIPIRARLGQQLISGRIDLMVKYNAGYALIDHKSFPGSPDRWESRAISHGSQLGLYAKAINAATTVACDKLYIHMPVVGALLRVARI